VYSELDEIPLNLPALARAAKLQKRAARVGFDWPSAEGAEQKLDEELAELRVARRTENREAIQEEFGDLIFTIVNFARHLGCDPEKALRAANTKFERRFRFIELGLAKDGLTPGDVDLDRLERLWQAAKSGGL
jgi:MazG family protein